MTGLIIKLVKVIYWFPLLVSLISDSVTVLSRFNRMVQEIKVSGMTSSESLQYKSHCIMPHDSYRFNSFPETMT